MSDFSLTNIEHIVVLMLENRSFDNLLGWQYGLSPTNGNTYLNPPPDGPSVTINSWGDTSMAATTIPNPDPGELFEQMNQQIFGLVETPPNGILPASVGTLGPMGGFAQNYLTIPGVDTTTVANIMHAYPAAQVRALSTLAASFVAVETYYASAPCQTLPNRCFAQLGTANGFVNNETVCPNGTRIINAPYCGTTIFNQISATGGLDWRVYFGDFPMTLAMVDVWDHISNFRWFLDFKSDVRNGDLPAYTWIEPSYLILPNDMHPPNSVALGDLLVAQVYNALRQSTLWDKTLLIITFDEHGGCYDRFYPGQATPPGGPYRDDFTFDRYGVRVPTVLCSPYIPAIKTGTAGPIYDHTSILSTVRSVFGVAGSPLSQREATATGLGGFLSLPPTQLNLGPESVSAASAGASPTPANEPLTSLQRVLVKLADIVPEARAITSTKAALAAYRIDKSTTEAPDRETGIRIVRDATDRLFKPPRAHQK